MSVHRGRRRGGWPIHRGGRVSTRSSVPAHLPCPPDSTGAADNTILHRRQHRQTPAAAARRRPRRKRFLPPLELPPLAGLGTGELMALALASASAAEARPASRARRRPASPYACVEVDDPSQGELNSPSLPASSWHLALRDLVLHVLLIRNPQCAHPTKQEEALDARPRAGGTIGGLPDCGNR